MATALAIESFLRCLMHDRDDLLRARFAALLDAGPVPRALLSAGGRLLHGRSEEWAPDGRLTVPGGGGELVLPSGARALAEPVAEGQAYVLSRLDHAPARKPQRRLDLRLLGEKPRAVLDGQPVALRPRHAELLVLLAARPKGTDAEHLSLELYGERGNPASVRVEMSRLRKLLPGCLHPERYMLAVAPHSDAEDVRRALREGDARAAAAAYPGALLERSEAPGVARERDELDGWLRNAVLTSGDVEALWHWTQSSSGADDLMAWSRLLGGIAYDDARRPHAAAHLKALRAALVTAV
jgi:hypothetical protein